VLLGTYLAGQPRPVLNYWIWVFALVAGGVAFLWVSARSAVWWKHGRSMWWLLTMVTYPVGWLMAFGGIIVRIFRFVKTRCGSGTCQRVRGDQKPSHACTMIGIGSIV